MTNDTTEPDWTPRIIATLAIVLALVGGALFVDEMIRAAPTVSATTNCAQFAADANKSFNNGGSATLSGPFAPGDHLHLAIDFTGVRYSWKATGVLGAAKTEVTGTAYTVDTTSEWKTPASGTSISESPPPKDAKSTTSGETRGFIGGPSTLDIDIEVATAGDGAISIDHRGSVPLVTSPRVVVASCTAARHAPAPSSGDVSSNGSPRSLSAPLG